jgi:hypothetical protein
MINLGQAITTGGIRNTNFFNGRLLSAEDLQAEQLANRRRYQQLDRAVGAGIITGLEVRLTPGVAPPTEVTVSAGLALNRRGQALALAQDVDLALVPQADPTSAGAGLFGDCEPPQPVLTGTGAYLLAVSPASAFDGRVPAASMTGLGSFACNCGGGGSRTAAAPAAGCGAAYAVEGVQFRLARVELSTAPGVDAALLKRLDDLMAQGTPASLSLLRNLLAHVCLGTVQRGGFPLDPLPGGGAGTNYPYLVDPLIGLGGLTDCDVPLALLYWTTDGIQFIDMGSVRRRVLPGPPDQPWPLAPAGGLPGFGEAVSVQFQEQVAQLTNLGRVRALDYFRHLPPVGVLPLPGLGGVDGVDYPYFFDSLPFREPTFIEGATLEALARASLTYEPIDLAAGELVWLYLVRENRQALDQGASPPPRPYLIFTGGNVPHQANPRLDLSRWDYTNYA